MKKTAILVTILIASLVVPAMAHHSFSAFNTQTEKTITGVVKTVQWSNPHIWLWVDVPNGQGKTDTYAFEGMSPNFLERRNWTRTTLKAGDKITISYNPMKDGTNGGMFRQGKMENGRVLTMGGSNEP
jgi:hypothetical protein